MRNQYGSIAVGMAMALSAGLLNPISASVPSLPDLSIRKQLEDQMAVQSKKYSFKREGNSFEIRIGDLDFRGEDRIGGTSYLVICYGKHLMREEVHQWRITQGLPEYSLYFNRSGIKSDKNGFDEIKKGQGTFGPHAYYEYIFEPHAIEVSRPLLRETRDRFLPQIKKKEKRLPQNNCIDELLGKLK